MVIGDLSSPTYLPAYADKISITLSFNFSPAANSRVERSASYRLAEQFRRNVCRGEDVCVYWGGGSMVIQIVHN